MLKKVIGIDESPNAFLATADESGRRIYQMLSPISMQSMPVQQAQPVQAKPQAAPAAAAASTPSASLQPDTVSLSSQAHAAAGHDGDGDGH